METVQILAWIIGSYLWGSLSPAHAAVKLAGGIDLRRYGTGNVGSSNVGAQLGLAWLLLVGVLDLLKGFAPSAMAATGHSSPELPVIAGVATLVGNNWSVFLGFAGGRGMAATIGILLAWDARLALLLLLILALGWPLRRAASASAIGLLLQAPASAILGLEPAFTAGTALIVLVVAAKRLEANRLPLPSDPEKRRAVLCRRLWLDRDVPLDQPWQERHRLD